MTQRDSKFVNHGGSRRVVVTKELPGERWLQLLTAADCREEIAQGDDILAAGALICSRYAVGYDNVDVPAATRLGLPVENTQGVQTETPAQPAVALTFAAARRGLEDVLPLVEDEKPPHAGPSIANSVELGLPHLVADSLTKEDQQ